MASDYPLESCDGACRLPACHRESVSRALTPAIAAVRARRERASAS